MSHSPSSPLSSYTSSPTHHSVTPPPPRRNPTMSPTPSHSSDISSDTSGSVPPSPSFDPHDDDPTEQITLCRWENCLRDFGSMDHLVQHIHDDHIGTRKATYACMWDDCTRKGMPHASGYALRAHMRSHTKEKPFYCSLPECDRSFTRSDALAKHMRTVHETEALRPSDPVPKGYTGLHGGKKRGWQEREEELEWSEDERAVDGRDLVRLLRMKEAWAKEEREELREELERLERRRRECWIKKEMLLDRVLKEELGEEEARKVTLDYVSE